MPWGLDDAPPFTLSPISGKLSTLYALQASLWQDLITAQEGSTVRPALRAPEIKWAKPPGGVHEPINGPWHVTAANVSQFIW